MSEHYGDKMAKAGREQARELMADALAPVLVLLTDNAKADIETALTIAFINGAIRRGQDVAAQTLKLLEAK